MLKKINGVVVSVMAFGMAATAHAETTPLDFSSITGAIDQTTIVNGMLAIAGTLGIIYAGRKGISLVLGYLKPKG